MKLGQAVSGMFKTYAKKPLLFSGIVLAVNIPLVLLEMFLFSGVAAAAVLAIASGNYGVLFGVAGLGTLVWMVISLVANVLLLGGTIRAVSHVVQGKAIGVIDALSYAFKRAWDYIILSLRIFWYSGAWLLLIFFLLLPILAGLMGGGTASAQTLDTTMDAESIERLMETGILDEFPGMFDTDVEGTMYANVRDFTPFFQMSPIFGLVYFVLLIFVVIRMLRTFFAYYILFDKDSISTKEALAQSIKLTKGNLWRIIGYSIVLGIIFSVISYFYTSIIASPVSKMFGMENMYNVYLLLMAIYGAVVTPIATIYYYLFYKGVQQEK